MVILLRGDPCRLEERLPVAGDPGAALRGAETDSIAPAHVGVEARVVLEHLERLLVVGDGFVRRALVERVLAPRRQYSSAFAGSADPAAAK